MATSAFDTPEADEDALATRRRLRWMIGVLVVLLLGVGLQWLVSRPVPPDLGSVSGVVTLDGKPVDKLQVVFLPDPEKGGSGSDSSASTDENGRYRVSLDRGEYDGASVGFHRVVVRDFSGVSPQGTTGLPPAPKILGPNDRPSNGRLAAEYADPFKTPLRPVEVKPGEQTYDIALTSPPKK